MGSGASKKNAQPMPTDGKQQPQQPAPVNSTQAAPKKIAVQPAPATIAEEPELNHPENIEFDNQRQPESDLPRSVVSYVMFMKVTQL